MATRVQGVAVSWGGAPLLEVTAVEFDLLRGLPQNRGAQAPWSINLGSVRVESLENNALPLSEYGKRKPLAVTYRTEAGAQQTLWQTDCIYEGATVQQLLNDAMRFAFTFRVMDTLNAGSHPA